MRKAWRQWLGGGCILACALWLAVACTAPAAGPGPVGQPAPPAGEPRAAPAAPLPRLRVSYGATVGVHVPIIAAQRTGEFERAGLTVEVQRIATNTSITALLTGDLDLVQVSAPALVSANLQGGADLVFIAGALDRMILSLYAAPNIRSGEDLRGKVVGTDRPGTPVAFATNLALARLGLTPSDVQLLPIGTDGFVPGLQAGQIQAAALTLPNSSAALRSGFMLLVALYDVPYQNIGIIARRADLERLAPALLPFLQAYRKGLERFAQDEAWGKEALASLLDTTDPAVLQETYDFFTKQTPFTPSLRVSREGLQGVLDSLKDTLPAAQTARPEQFYDHRFVDQLDARRA
jgi:ABC-type nitrate/sulfonate/bicarbonate transport system substrate-binding protein